MSAKYICTGSPPFSPRSNATVGETGPMMTSHCLNASEILRDQAADLLRLEVIRVVIAVRQHVSADQDAALHFRAEAFGARLPIHVEQVVVFRARWP